jgi:hypothetical protein
MVECNLPKVDVAGSIPVSRFYTFLCAIVLYLAFPAAGSSTDNYSYAVVISKAAYADAGWKAVADTLLKIHGKTGSRLFTWSSSVTECKADLAAFMPTYIGFVARPASECNTSFMASASSLSRSLDSDPYGDAYWSVITGFQASDALRAVTESLTVKTVLLGANDLSYEPPLQRFFQGVGMTCDSYTKTDYIFPNTAGKVYTADARPGGEKDRVNLVCTWLNAGKIDLSVSGKGSVTGPIDCLVTGGHGNVDTWQCHYPEAGTEGYVRSQSGQLFGQTGSGTNIDINVPNPMIYWCASNCRMATPDSKSNFVYAAFHSGHAVQMYGFIPDAASGDDFVSWGVYDRLTKFAGRYTLPQGLFIAINNSIFELKHSTGQFDEAGVKSYLDAMGMYGDPAANVRFWNSGDSARSYTEKFTSTAGENGLAVFEYAVTASAHAITFGQGYCYQFRPVFFMPVRIDVSSLSITKNDGHVADITDNLIVWEMLAKGENLARGATKTLRFTAKVIGGSGTAVKAPSQARALPLPALRAAAAPGGKGLRVAFQNIPAGRMKVRVTDAAGKRLCRIDATSRGPERQSIFLPQKIGRGVTFLSVTNGKLVLKEKIAAGE